MVSLGSFGPRGTPSQQVSFRKTEALMEMNILDIRLFWDCTKPGGRNLTHFIHFILHYYNENKGAAMLFLCSSVLTKTNNSYLFVISQINICTKHLKAQTRAANKVWAERHFMNWSCCFGCCWSPGERVHCPGLSHLCSPHAEVISHGKLCKSLGKSWQGCWWLSMKHRYSVI